jgi:hypothetical protein
MITIEQAKKNLLSDIETPQGKLKLYGINIIPSNNQESEGFGLIFYIQGKQKIFWNVDCEEVKSSLMNEYQ